MVVDATLSAWNLKRVAMVDDGNHLFSSVAFCVQHQINTGNQALRTHLLELGLPEDHLLTGTVAEKGNIHVPRTTRRTPRTAHRVLCEGAWL